MGRAASTESRQPPSEQAALDLALEELLQFFAQRLFLATQPGHAGKPMIDLLLQVPREHGLHGGHFFEGAHDGERDAIADDGGRRGGVLSGEVQHFVAWSQSAALLLHDPIVDQALHVQRHRARVEARHQVPRIAAALIPRTAKVAAQDHRRDVGELREHELHDGAAIELRAVEVEEREVAFEERANVLVPDGLRVQAAEFEVLGEAAEEAAV
jgi:hypothetical protein